MAVKSTNDVSLSYAVVPTAWGWMGLAASDLGVCAVSLPEPSREQALAALGLAGQDGGAPESFGDLPRRLQRYFLGEAVSFTDPLDLRGYTSFQRAVWEVVQRIPRGQTRSYGAIAAAAGYPKAARAVGQAVGANPVGILIP